MRYLHHYLNQYLFLSVEIKANDSEEHDLDIPQDSFPDAVLNHVCSTCRKSMFEVIIVCTFRCTMNEPYLN